MIILTEYVSVQNKIVIIKYYLCNEHYLIKKENIIEIAKNKGFPRPSGHCKVIEIYKLKGFQNDSYYDEDYLHEVLDKLYDLNYDLVKGDIVLFEKSRFNLEDWSKKIFMFDGCNLVNIYYSKEYDFIAPPKEFSVITNGVPIDYWNQNNENDIFDGLVWLDPKLIGDQLIENIIYDQVIITSFEFNNKNYIINIEETNGEEEEEEDYGWLKEFKREIFYNKLLSLSLNENGEII